MQFMLISAFVYHRPPRVVDIFFALCVIFLCITHAILVSSDYFVSSKSWFCCNFYYEFVVLIIHFFVFEIVVYFLFYI